VGLYGPEREADVEKTKVASNQNFRRQDRAGRAYPKSARLGGKTAEDRNRAKTSTPKKYQPSEERGGTRKTGESHRTFAKSARGGGQTFSGGRYRGNIHRTETLV